MKLPSWKIILSFVAIFIAGAVCGTVVTLGVVKKIVTQHQRFEGRKSTRLNSSHT